MATSGTYNFTVTRDELIAASLRLLEVYGEGDTITPTAMTNCAQALNIWVKALCMKGLYLWCVQDITVPNVIGQATYNIGPLSSQPRPLRILAAYLRGPNDNDVNLTITSRYDYITLGEKTAQGIPNQLFYDPQLQNGIVTLYNVPSSTDYTLHLVIQRQIQDFNLSTDNPDFPQEAFQMLKWGLANEIGPEYGCRDVLLDRVERRATMYMTEFADSQQEQVSIFLTPSERSF